MTTNASEPFWTKGASMPTPRTEVAAAISADNIYAIGGFDESGHVTGIVEVYSINNNSWTKAAPLPQSLHHTAAASYDGKIYVIGGYTSQAAEKPWTATNKHFIYDPIESKWQEGKPMPTERGGIAAASLVNGSSSIHVFGGEEPSKTFNNNEKYDVKDTNWIFELPMPTACHGLGAVSNEDRIYVIGGGPQPGLSVSNVNEIFRTR
jgi:hypothetical protein